MGSQDNQASRGSLRPPSRPVPSTFGGPWQRFQAAHKKGSEQHNMYHQSKGHKQKSEFRAKWAKDDSK